MSYCAQGRKGRYPNKNCSSCSLTNYGLDCRNNPVPTDPAPKRLVGMDKAIDTYRSGGGFTGTATMQAILSDVSDELRARLTGYELGLVMLAVARAYHKGRASHGGIDLCDDAVWLPWGGGLAKDDPEWQGGNDPKGNKERGQLIPIAALRQIKIDKTATELRSFGKGPNAEVPVTRYTLDYTES